jgi:hypothetical protein
MTTKTQQIRVLNDQLRQNFSEGSAVMTCGVAALGAEAVARIVKTIAVYDGPVIYFKIDYYDKTLTCHSRDAEDRSVTERVITVMLAEEY